jgi:SAM-dependent methyltransferase
LAREEILVADPRNSTGNVTDRVLTSGVSRTKHASKRLIRALVPMSLRKRMAVGLQRQTWINKRRRQWWSVELVRDLAETDLNGFHQFLWANHLGYAESYEARERFGSVNVKASRRMFFADLLHQLARLGVSPLRDIRSVFEVGCSLGYQLRFMETDIFPNATDLRGIDLDEYAIRSGSSYLHAAGSKVVLQRADLTELETVLGPRQYDLIICTGVLMYLSDDLARAAVAMMLRHSRILALAGLAHPEADNAELQEADVRADDRTFIHNLDAMVRHAGGEVIGRRWEGPRDVDGNTIYFVFATGA